MSDIILFLLLALSLWFGWKKGVVKILAGPGAIIGGIFFANRLVSFAAPLVAAKLQTSAGSADVVADGLLSELFFSSGFFGRLVETVMFLLLVGVVIFLIRKLTKAMGDVINATPFIGFVCRMLGALLAFLCMAALVCMACFWLVPWLSLAFPGVMTVEEFFEESVLVIPVLKDVCGIFSGAALYGISIFK